MASNSRNTNEARTRNRRFLNNLQQSMGTSSNFKKNKQKQIKTNNDLMPKDYDELIEMLNSEKRNLSLSTLGEYYKENYTNFDDEQITKVAEILYKIGYQGDAIYEFIAFMNEAFCDDRFQDKMAQEFILSAASLFDIEEPNLEQYEEFGRFIGLVLKTKFNRPFHQIVDTSNKFLVSIMNVFLGFISEVPQLLESDDEESIEQAKYKTTAVVCAVKTLNRRLFMDYYEMNDDIYKFLRSALIDTDGKKLGKEFRFMLLSVIIEMEKYSVAGAPPSKTSVSTQTISIDDE